MYKAKLIVTATLLGLIISGVYAMFAVKVASYTVQGTIVAITNYTAPAPCIIGTCGTMPQTQLRIQLQHEISGASNGHIGTFNTAIATSSCQNYWHLNDAVSIERIVHLGIFPSSQDVMHDHNDAQGVVGQCGSLTVNFE